MILDMMMPVMDGIELLRRIRSSARWKDIPVVIYSAGFALSWGPVTWVLLSEMFPNAIKNRALAIAVAAQWIANLFVSWSFKVLD